MCIWNLGIKLTSVENLLEIVLSNFIIKSSSKFLNTAKDIYFKAPEISLFAFDILVYTKLKTLIWVRFLKNSNTLTFSKETR